MNHEGIAGTAAAMEWIGSLGAEGTLRERLVGGMAAIHSLEGPLLQRLRDGLRQIPGARIHGPPEGHPRTPTLALVLDGRHPTEVAARLAREGVFVWSGDFYASTVIDRLGLRAGGGVIRIGLAPYNTPEDVDRLLRGLS